MHWHSQIHTRASKISFKKSHQMDTDVRRWDISGTTERSRARISGIGLGEGHDQDHPDPSHTWCAATFRILYH